ncbi:MAG: tetratricopeptide repeat protein [Pelobacteraceae bacterium]
MRISHLTIPLKSMAKRSILTCFIALLAVSSLSFAAPAFSEEQPEDYQIFITGFDAYQRKDFNTSKNKLNEVLEKFPDTPLRDVSLFWLSRSYYRIGNLQEAGRYLSQFVREYPDSPLKGVVEDELYRLVASYKKGETLPNTAEKKKTTSNKTS